MTISQLNAWLIVAASAPILSFGDKAGWMAVGFAAIPCFIISATILLINAEVPQWVRFFELIGIILYLGSIAREVETSWQDLSDGLLLPLVLLITAAIAVRNGAKYGARSAAALLWFVVPGICIILLAGIGDLQLPSFRVGDEKSIFAAVPLFLLPILGRYSVQEKTRELLKSVVIIGAVAIAAGLWLSASGANDFYEYSKGITLLGVAERFEAVSACLLTAGWFALFAFLFGVVFEILEAQKKGSGRWGVAVGGLCAILLMYNLPISLPVVGILTLIFWGILPLATQAVDGIKKSKKSKKPS